MISWNAAHQSAGDSFDMKMRQARTENRCYFYEEFSLEVMLDMVYRRQLCLTWLWLSRHHPCMWYAGDVLLHWPWCHHQGSSGSLLLPADLGSACVRLDKQKYWTNYSIFHKCHRAWYQSTNNWMLFPKGKGWTWRLSNTGHCISICYISMEQMKTINTNRSCLFRLLFFDMWKLLIL